MQNQLSPIRADEFGPIREKVFSTLRNAIISGKLAPGERLVERDIAEKLGISRTPVREAIRKLELEHLVTHIPRKGVVVAGLSREEVIEILSIREVLEGLICRFAAERIELKDLEKMENVLIQFAEGQLEGNSRKVNVLHDRFHDVIYRSAKSSRLYELISNLTDYTRKFAQVGYLNPGRPEEALIEHQKILDALRKHSGEEAERMAIEHVKKSTKAYLRAHAMIDE